MSAAFYIAAAVAIVATVLVITRTRAVHALLYLVVSLLAIALCFYTLGAPFAAALQVIVYAGAIMVLFVFAVMTLNLGEAAAEQERAWLSPRVWWGPAALAAVLLAEMGYVLIAAPPGGASTTVVPPRAVGASLYGPYLLAVELASFLLLAALVGAYHLGSRAGARRDG
jgi:NADH-quinone oxidoreductase subunit J